MAQKSHLVITLPRFKFSLHTTPTDTIDVLNYTVIGNTTKLFLPDHCFLILKSIFSFTQSLEKGILN